MSGSGGGGGGGSQVSRASSAGSAKSSTAIDPNQLLSLCFHINENIDKLDRSISLVQLRLTGLSYLRNQREQSGGGIADLTAPVRCLNDLADLCQLSQAMVKQLDELQVKLSEEDSRKSIGFHIASQQLAYFTSEWYDSLTPKFNATLRLANELQLDEQTNAKRRGLAWSRVRLTREERGASRAAGAGQPQVASQQLGGPAAGGAAELRVRDALVRLKQSMSENERLIASISSNLDYTKSTIESIYQSLRTTKVNLEAGEKNAIESIQVVRSSERSKFCLKLTCAIILVLVILVALRLVGII